MPSIVPPNLLPSARRFLAYQLSAHRLGHSKEAFPSADICDPAVARERVVEHCAIYGDAREEIDHIWAELTELFETVERIAVPMFAEATIAQIEQMVAALVRGRHLEPVDALAERLTFYAEIQYVRMLMDRRDREE